MKKILVMLLCAFIPTREGRKKIRRKFFPEKFLCIMGRHSYVGKGFIRAHKQTSIGAFCSIGTNVAMGPSQHPITWLSTSPFMYKTNKKIVKSQKLMDWSYEPVVCGNDVWIGNNVIVQDGVKIGDGAIIGSNAVVTHDVPAYAIVVGCPGRVIRYRFSEEVIGQLLDLKWWDLSDEQIAKLPFDNIEKCIELLKKIRAEE